MEEVKRFWLTAYLNCTFSLVQVTFQKIRELSLHSSFLVNYFCDFGIQSGAWSARVSILVPQTSFQSPTIVLGTIDSIVFFSLVFFPFMVSGVGFWSGPPWLRVN